MARIDEAREEIKKAKKSNDPLLHLSNYQLRSDDLQQLIPEIAQLPQLTSLDLAANELTTLPDSITRLTQLTELDLRDNQLTTPPKKSPVKVSKPSETISNKPRNKG